MPPAFLIAASADLENLDALTVNFFVKAPFPNILTPFNSFVTSPASFNNVGVTTTSSSNLFKSSTLTIAYSTRVKLVKPCFGKRLNNGF